MEYPNGRFAGSTIGRAIRSSSGSHGVEVMPEDLAPDDRAALESGEHLRGRSAIAAGHAEIFRTIYAGSTNHYTIEGARLLGPEVALVHVHALMDAPHGPLAGRHGARFSLVLTKQPGG